MAYNTLMVGFRKYKWVKIASLVVGLVVIALALYVIRPDTYLPHKRTLLRAPFDLDDPPTRLLPMGEKVYHPDSPSGHPGIDLQWDHPDARILSSADGKITSITPVFDKWDKWEIDIETWPYVIRYKELETYDQNLRVGQHVKAGDYLGTVANPKAHNVEGAYQIHWEFASLSLIRDRFCPMTYFDDAPKASIEAAWAATTWEYKSQYPDVCSGDYANKTD